MGTLPFGVAVAMDFLHQDLDAGVKVLDASAATAERPAQRTKLLKDVAVFAATILERFFTIHPYVNGNGHMGRLVVWLLLTKYGFPPKSWTVDERPPGYIGLIDEHRAGKTKPLAAFIIKSVGA